MCARTEGLNETARIEAFSDGVFAIAMTLLVLDLKVPHELGNRRLLHALSSEWPTYLAYVTSFLTVLIMWINHHQLFRLIRRTNQGLLFLNGLLLLCVTFVPFPTSLVSEYVRHEQGRTAALVYSGTFTFIGIVFNVLWWYCSSCKKLLDEHVDPSTVKSIARRYAMGPVTYGLAFVLAFVNVIGSLALILLIPLIFAIPFHTPSGSNPRK